MDHDRWLTRFDPRPDARARLLCFPHGGGNATFYRDWSRSSPRAIELIAIQYPGRMNRLSEPAIDAMEPMADAIAEVLGARSDVPYALFGHSMGAAIAFEVALRLEAGGTPALRHLFVSGRRAPAAHRPGRRHLVSDDAIISYLRVLGGTDAALFRQPELWPMVLPILRSDFKLSETWRPRRDASLRASLTALTGDDDPEVSVSDAAAWQGSTTGSFALRVMAGRHFFLTDHRPEILAQISATLADD